MLPFQLNIYPLGKLCNNVIGLAKLRHTQIGTGGGGIVQAAFCNRDQDTLYGVRRFKHNDVKTIRNKNQFNSYQTNILSH